MDTNDAQIEKQMQERFKQLPKPVQEAITSADVQKHLRELANTHQLHIDQWTALENEVMLSLLGFEPMADLPNNIQKEVGVDAAAAASIAADISKIVFEPIRGELERKLDHPDAVAAASTNVDAVRTQILADESSAEMVPRVPAAPAPESAPATPSIVPATPPAPAPTAQVERAPATGAAYTPGAASHERKEIAGDPYREQI